MDNLLSIIQSVAVNAVKSTKPMDYRFGVVTKASPLTVRLNDSTLEVSGNALILTSGVVERKLTIKKHNHPVGDAITSHIHPIPDGESSVSTDLIGKTVDDTVLDAVASEYGKNLPVNSSKDEIVITINKGLAKDDKVIMLAVAGGQRFIILSRVFMRDENG